MCSTLLKTGISIVVSTVMEFTDLAAEYITIGNAICAGEREFDTIVAVHEHAPNKLYAPCGNCRQMLIEYCPDIHVILNDDEGNIRKVCIRDLLPFAWKQAPDF